MDFFNWSVKNPLIINMYGIQSQYQKKLSISKYFISSPCSIMTIILTELVMEVDFMIDI